MPKPQRKAGRVKHPNPTRGRGRTQLPISIRGKEKAKAKRHPVAKAGKKKK